MTAREGTQFIPIIIGMFGDDHINGNSNKLRKSGMNNNLKITDPFS
jgi:hypothetical protein